MTDPVLLALIGAFLALGTTYLNDRLTAGRPVSPPAAPALSRAETKTAS